MHFLERGVRLPRTSAPAPTHLPRQTRVAIPLSRGEAALVQVGQQVQAGEPIAEGGSGATPVHASIAGTVTAIAPRTCADGRRHPVVVIENEGPEPPEPDLHPRALADDLSDEALVDLLFEAGIRLPDGTPLADAVADAGPGLRTLIISAMDPEPGLCIQDAALRFQTEAVLSGVRVLQRLLRPAVSYLAAAKTQQEGLDAARRWAGSTLAIAAIPDLYPAGHPKLLAQRLGGLRPGESARSSGVLLLPATAAAACGSAVYLGLPVTQQAVAVTTPEGVHLFQAPLGTPVEAVLRAAEAGDGPVVLGGAMTGKLLENRSVPLEQGMEALLVGMGRIRPTAAACIRCGRCAAVCPMGLLPWRSQSRRQPRPEPECLRCGACRYACPAGLALPEAAVKRGKEVLEVG